LQGTYLLSCASLIYLLNADQGCKIGTWDYGYCQTKNITNVGVQLMLLSH
jgi:hypothetical protein